MSEWWTYRLSDFLMFSPRIYWRLVEQYNRDVWPAQLLGLVVGITAMKLATLRQARADRALAALLAASWLWVGWAFHWQRYATINWSAQYIAMAFALQAALLVGVAATAQPTARRAGGERHARSAPRRVAGWLAVGGGLLYPFFGAIAGRPWTQAEVFAIAPEPTALATLGLLALAGPAYSSAARRVLAVIPSVSLVLGAATLWVMSD